MQDDLGEIHWTRHALTAAGGLAVLAIAFQLITGWPPLPIDEPPPRRPAVAVAPPPKPPAVRPPEPPAPPTPMPPVEPTPKPAPKLEPMPEPVPLPPTPPAPTVPSPPAMPPAPPVIPAPPVMPVVARPPLLELNPYEEAVLGGYLPMLADAVRTADTACEVGGVPEADRPAARTAERYRKAYDDRFVELAKPVFTGIVNDMREVDRTGAGLLARVLTHRIDLPAADGEGRRFGRTEAERRELFQADRRLARQVEAVGDQAGREALAARCVAAFLTEKRLRLAELLAVRDEAAIAGWAAE